jgi:hypothetical protein
MEGEHGYAALVGGKRERGERGRGEEGKRRETSEND